MQSLKETGKKKGGFSLVELIVIMAIGSVLVGVLAPSFLRYIEQNRKKACQVNREEILGIYERCVYEETLAIQEADLQNLLAGGMAQTKDEVFQYVECPSGGAYTAQVTNGIARIKCDHEGHDDVILDLTEWSGTDLGEDIDAPFPSPTPIPTLAPSPTPTEAPTPTPEPTGPATGDYWPYEDDSRWEGKAHVGWSIDLTVPSGLFTSKQGNVYVIIDRSGGTGIFPVYYEWNNGPETIDNRGWEHVISYSGITIKDIDSIRIPGTENQITGIHYGDIIEYDGKKWIYASHYDGYYIDLPKNGQNGSGNFYYVNPGGALKP